MTEPTRTPNIPELLSPAANWDSLRAAVNCGANAVYAGGARFSARSVPQDYGFTDAQLLEAVDYCHLRGVKLYAAINTLYKNAELDDVFRFAASLYEAGADAFITQDIGVAMALRRRFPGARLHASTQTTAHDLESVLFLEQAGFDRVVLARELSLEEIRHITQNVRVETEVFVHGSLCVCYSGQCLMSGMMGGRSGNRGKCAQPCRLPYRLLRGERALAEGYLLSTRDMMTLELLPEIAGAGVAALKIEGRLKSPEYVGETTRAYAEQLRRVENGRPFVPSRDTDRLAQVFNRGGVFSTGYYNGSFGREVMSVESPKNAGLPVGAVISADPAAGRVVIELARELNPGDGVEIWTRKEPHPGGGVNRHAPARSKLPLRVSGEITHVRPGDRVFRTYDKALADELKRHYAKDTRQMDVTCQLAALPGRPLTITLRRGGVEITAEGVAVQEAKGQPLSRERLLEQAGKTGGSPFAFTFENCEIGGNIFAAVSDINALRRETAERFAKAWAASFKREPAPGFISEPPPEPAEHASNESAGQKRLSTLVQNPEQLEAALEEGVSLIFLEAREAFMPDMDAFARRAQSQGAELFAALPRGWRDETAQDAMLAALEATAIHGYLIRTHGQLRALEKSAKKKMLDHSFNVMNSLSFAYFRRFADVVTLSPELTLGEINEIASGDAAGAEIVIHGRLPLMVTRQCPAGRLAGEDGAKACPLRNAPGEYALKDRKGAIFPLLRDCGRCSAVIVNSRPLATLGITGLLRVSAPRTLRLFFTTEPPEDVRQAIRAYAAPLIEGERGPETEALAERLTEEGATGGHFRRGVL